MTQRQHNSRVIKCSLFVNCLSRIPFSLSWQKIKSRTTRSSDISKAFRGNRIRKKCDASTLLKIYTINISSNTDLYNGHWVLYAKNWVNTFSSLVWQFWVLTFRIVNCHFATHKKEHRHTERSSSELRTRILWLMISVGKSYSSPRRILHNCHEFPDPLSQCGSHPHFPLPLEIIHIISFAHESNNADA